MTEEQKSLDEFYSKIAKGTGTTVELIKKEVKSKMAKTLKTEEDCLDEVGKEKGIDIKSPEFIEIKDIQDRELCNLVTKLVLKKPVSDKVSREGNPYRCQTLRVLDNSGECWVTVYGENNFKELEKAERNDVVAFRNAIGSKWAATEQYPETINLKISDSSKSVTSFILVNPEIETNLPEVPEMADKKNWKYIDLNGEYTEKDKLDNLLRNEDGTADLDKKVLNFKIDGTIQACGDEIEQTKNGSDRFWISFRDVKGEDIYVVLWKDAIAYDLVEEIMSAQKSEMVFTVSEGIANLYLPHDGSPRVQINCNRENSVTKREK